MLYATLQPSNVLRQLTDGKDYTPSNNFSPSYDIFEGTNPVFCYSANSTRETLTNFLATCTSMPQAFIMFEVDNTIQINKLRWNQYLTNGNPDSIYEKGLMEHVVPCILAKQFRAGCVISDSDVIDEVQGEAIEFMANHAYKIINEVVPVECRENLRIRIGDLSPEMSGKFLNLTGKINFYPMMATPDDVCELVDKVIPAMLQVIEDNSGLTKEF